MLYCTAVSSFICLFYHITQLCCSETSYSVFIITECIGDPFCMSQPYFEIYAFLIFRPQHVISFGFKAWLDNITKTVLLFVGTSISNKARHDRLLEKHTCGAEVQRSISYEKSDDEHFKHTRNSTHTHMLVLV